MLAMRPAAARPAAARPAAARPAAVRPAAVRPAAVRPAAVRPAAMRPTAMRPADARPFVRGLAAVRRLADDATVRCLFGSGGSHSGATCCFTCQIRCQAAGCWYDVDWFVGCLVDGMCLAGWLVCCSDSRRPSLFTSSVGWELGWLTVCPGRTVHWLSRLVCHLLASVMMYC